MNKSSLKQVEKRTYMTYHQDGLIDIFVGVYILLFGLGIFLQTITDFSTWFVFPGVFPAVMVPIWISVKKRITIPRIGYVKFGSRGANRFMAVILGLMVFGLGVFMVFGLGAAMDQGWAVTLRTLIFSNSMIIIGVGAAIISSLFAYNMGLKRLYAYGLLTLVLFLTGHFITIPFQYFLLTTGFAIVIYGLILMVQFIQKYPITRGNKTIVEKSL